MTEQELLESLVKTYKDLDRFDMQLHLAESCSRLGMAKARVAQQIITLMDRAHKKEEK